MILQQLSPEKPQCPQYHFARSLQVTTISVIVTSFQITKFLDFDSIYMYQLVSS